MPDQINLSLWIRGFDEGTMLRHFQELLRIFPFSRLRPGISLLRVYAMEFAEPPVVEQAFTAEADVPAVIQIAGEFRNADCAYLVDGWWEMLQYSTAWELKPAPVTLSCYGPLFENDEGDHLRIELGPDVNFLPQPGLPDGVRKAQSNLKGLLRLVKEIEGSMPVERRRLWTESGENFAEMLDDSLADGA